MTQHSTKTVWVLVLVILLELLLVAWSSEDQLRYPNVYMIPKGYVGWVQIHYNVPDAPLLPRNNENAFLYHIDKQGRLSTSKKDTEFGSALDQYYYVDDQGNKELLDLEKHIHGDVYGSSEWKGREINFERFFIGTEEEYRYYQSHETEIEE